MKLIRGMCQDLTGPCLSVLPPIDEDKEEPVPPQSKEYEWVEYQKIEDWACDGPFELVNNYDMAGLTTIPRMFDENFSEEGLRPWQVGSWFTDTCEEAASILQSLGRELTGDFEQHQISSSSAVLRASTTKGRVYLKASTKRDAMALQIASSFASFLVRKPLHVNVEKEWMLMEDYGPTLDRKFSREDFQNILLLHGKLQLQSVQHVSKLTQAGIPQQNAESIMRRTREMLDDPEIREAFARIRKLASPNENSEADLTKSCETVSTFLNHLYDANRVPLALVHGDLYDDNIIRIEGDSVGYVVYDWGCASIDIPFSDVIGLETEIVEAEQEREDGIDSYLELWTEYGSLSELRELCKHIDAKVDLVRLLQRYKCAKSHEIHPGLEDDDMKYLFNTLQAIQQLTK